MDIGDLEGCVEALYRLAGFDDDAVDFPSRVARRLLGPEAIVRVPGLKTFAALSRVNGEARIAVRQSLSQPRREHAIGHELGHWVLEREGCDGEDLEGACDFIGAAIQTRRRVFREVAKHRDWTQLALDFSTTETLVALRYGETTGTPLAVVAPHAVRVRGDDFSWPEADEIRKRAKSRSIIPGVAKARLRDDPRRVVLVAE